MVLIRCLFAAKLRLFDVVLTIVLLMFGGTCGYDPLDPNGNVTIQWDVLQGKPGGTLYVKFSIINYQLFRHVELPGWKLSWAWPGKEVIWNMLGALATDQGDCSEFQGGQPPHCCEKKPVIIDLLPGAPYNKQVANCCKGGVLTSMTQDPAKYLAAFQMSIGRPSFRGLLPEMPTNFSLGLPGYTCGEPFQVPATKFLVDQGLRRTQALATWNVICSYSQFLASPAPTCCVSLSAFYDETIVPCPKCTCACQGQAGAECVKAGEIPPVLKLARDQPPKPVVHCSQHMCPIKVHWHVKLNYRLYWRVKVTVTNLNHAKNYSQWTLVVSHPNLNNVTQVFSFNYRPLNIYGDINDTGMFYGIQHYNDMLLHAGEDGNVQTEMLLGKEAGAFTFRAGWAFPRKVSFNGMECVMPSPDEYPRLPNAAVCFDASLLVLLSILVVMGMWLP